MIESGKSYTAKEFEAQTGLGAYAIRQAERCGLKTTIVGSKKMILGDHWLEFLRNGKQTDREESSTLLRTVRCGDRLRVGEAEVVVQGVKPGERVAVAVTAPRRLEIEHEKREG